MDGNGASNGWTVAAVASGMLTFGLLYNLAIEAIKDNRYTAIYVVGGVLATLAGAAILIGIANALLTLICFAASGLPMVAGSLRRNIEQDRDARKQLEEALSDQAEDRRLRDETGN